VPEITVTGADLAMGGPWPSGNPVARAVRRALPDAWWVTAALRSATVIGRDGTREYRLPDEAAAALARWYDRPREAQPFLFAVTGADLIVRPAKPPALLAPPSPLRPVTVLAITVLAGRRRPPAMRGGPRCGQSMGWRGEKRYGRPAGHPGTVHLSEEACERQAQQQAAARAGGAA